MSQGTCANPVLSSSLSPFSTRGICRDMVHDSAGWVNLCGEDYRCPREKTIELNSPLCDDRNSPPGTCLFSFYQAYLPMAKQVDPLGSIPNSSQHNNSVASTRPPSNHLTAAAVLRAPVGNAGTAAAPKIKRSELPLRAQVDLDPSRSTQLERSGPSCVAVCLRVVYAPHEEQPQVVGIATRCPRFRIFWSPTHPHRLTLDKFRPKRWN
jgi:hypothetical protein